MCCLELLHALPDVGVAVGEHRDQHRHRDERHQGEADEDRGREHGLLLQDPGWEEKTARHPGVREKNGFLYLEVVKKCVLKK